LVWNAPCRGTARLKIMQHKTENYVTQSGFLFTHGKEAAAGPTEEEVAKR
jgi:hypothetical protein